LLKLFFLSDLVSRDGRKQRATGSAQVCWEMYKKEGEAKETLLAFSHSSDEVKKKQTQLNGRVVMYVLYSS